MPNWARARQQQICEKLFKALTDKATDPRGVRRPTTLGTLCALADATAAEVTEVIDVFRKPSRSFLMPPAGEALETETVIDISHESLMRVWERLKTWADEEAQSAQIYRRLADTAARHAAGKAGLWRDPDLQLALGTGRSAKRPNATWASRYGTEEEFELVRKFLRASEEQAAELRQQELIAEQARKAQEERERTLQQQASRFKRVLWASAVLGVCVIGTSIAAWLAFTQAQLATQALGEAKIFQEKAETARVYAEEQKQAADKLKELAEERRVEAEGQTTLAINEKGEADKQRVRAEELSRMSSSREIATNAAQKLQANPELAVELAIKALREAATPQAEGALQQAVLAFRLPRRIFQGMQSNEIVRITPDINVAMVTSRSDSKVRLHNITAGGQPIVIDVRGPTALIVLSPNGKYVVIPDSETSVGVWETTTGKPVAGPLRLEEGLNRAFFSAHGELLGLTTKAGKLGLWETQTWRPLPSVGDPLRTAPVFSSDSKYFIAAGAGEDRRFRLWETATGQAVAPIGDDTIQVSSALFSPDGKYIVTTSPKRAPSLWSTKLERIGDIGDPSRPVDRVQFSPDGSQLVSTASDGVRIWSIDKAGVLRELGHFAMDPSRPVNRVQFSPDGSQLVTTVSDGVRIWSIDKAGALKERDFKAAIRMPEFTRDGKSMLTISPPPPGRPKEQTGDVIQIWRSPFNESSVELKGHAGGVSNARFSQDGRWIVSNSDGDGTAKVWDAITGRVVANFLVGLISDAQLSADSRRLLTTSRDGTRRIWDTIEFGSVTPLSDLPESKETNRLISGLDTADIAQDGKYLLAIGADGFARIWDIGTGHLKAKLGDGDHKAKRVKFSTNGKHAITTGHDQTARVWDVETGLMLTSLPRVDGTDLIVAAFSDDAHPWTWHKGKDETIIRVWSQKESGPIHSIQALGHPSCITVSPKVSWVVTCEQVVEQKEGAGEAIVRVRQLISGKEPKEVQQLRGHTGQINDVFFSQDGRLAVSTSYDKTAKLWDVSSWRTIATLSGHKDSVKLAFFSPDSKYVVTTAAAEDNTARVWETTKGTLISELRGHTNLIKTLAFSGNGLWLASGSEDHTVRVWDIKTGGAVAELYGPAIAVAFSQDSKVIVSASADGTIRRYQCAHCIPTAELLGIAQQRLKANGKLAESPIQR